MAKKGKKSGHEALDKIMGKQKKLPVVKKTGNSNNIKDVVDSDTVDEVIAEIISKSGDKKTDKFLLLWLFGFSAKAAALSAGYAKSYAESGVQARLKTPKLRQRLDEITQVMPEKYRSLCRLRLIDVFEIEEEVLKVMKDKPELAMKHPQLLRQIKQSSGALADEGQPPQPINIETLQIIQQNQLTTCEDRLKKMGEVIESPRNVTPAPEEGDQEDD